MTVFNPEDHKCEGADISPETLDGSRVAHADGASPRFNSTTATGKRFVSTH